MKDLLVRQLRFRVEGNLSSPASLAEGGGGKGAGGGLGTQPQRDKGGMLLTPPPSLAEGIKEVRSPGRTKERKGAGWYIQQDV